MLAIHHSQAGRPFYMLDDKGLMFGCNLVCPKSGKRAVYAVVGRCRNEDGVVAWWDLVPSPFTLKHRPELAVWAVRVFNDEAVKPPAGRRPGGRRQQPVGGPT